MDRLSRIAEIVGSKICHYVVSVAGGLLVAFEASILFFVPCLIATVIDIWAAYCLSRRMHKLYPQKADGKFKSEYKYRVMYTMIVALVAVMLANYVDVYVIKQTDIMVRWVVGFFLFYQLWSILENWSSQNDNKLARALQRIMISKAERHLNVPLADILLGIKDIKEEKKDGKCE